MSITEAKLKCNTTGRMKKQSQHVKWFSLRQARKYPNDLQLTSDSQVMYGETHSGSKFPKYPRGSEVVRLPFPLGI